MSLGDKLRKELEKKGQKIPISQNKPRDLKSEQQNRDGKDSRFDFRYHAGFENVDSLPLALTKMKPIKAFGNLAPYGKGKKKVLEEIIRIYENEKNEKLMKRRIKVLRKFYEKAGFTILKTRLKKKMIVGIGRENSLENSITLHHIYGFPYIPASSVKGVLRYIALADLTDWDPEKMVCLDEKLSKRFISECGKHLSQEDKLVCIFGSKEMVGKVIFGDALPDGNEFPKLSIDVINPHYSKYYHDKPQDWLEDYEIDNPTPIFFLVVEKGSFTFHYKIDRRYEFLEDILQSLFDKAFKEGFGSKTRYGYGVMERK